MDEQIKPRIEVDVDAGTITIPHWGITQRSMHRAAIDAWKPKAGDRRDFDVILKGAVVATIHVQQHTEG